jgi:hypothetical protein
MTNQQPGRALRIRQTALLIQRVTAADVPEFLPVNLIAI